MGGSPKSEDLGRRLILEIGRFGLSPESATCCPRAYLRWRRPSPPSRVATPYRAKQKRRDSRSPAASRASGGPRTPSRLTVRKDEAVSRTLRSAALSLRLSDMVTRIV